MSVTDSTRNSRACATSLGLAGDALDIIMGAGIDMLAKRAFCTAVLMFPGRPMKPLFEEAIKDMFGGMLLQESSPCCEEYCTKQPVEGTKRAPA